MACSPLHAACRIKQCAFRTNAPAARSRARKSVENKIQVEKLGLHDQPRRAVDCAPYLNSLRLSAFGQRLARGHLGRSARKVSGACQRLFSSGTVLELQN